VTVVQNEVMVVVGAYVLAALPIGAILLAGRMSPLYRLPGEQIWRWWSWFALAIVAFAILMSAAGLAG
jgi:hypothetical protein